MKDFHEYAVLPNKIFILRLIEKISILTFLKFYGMNKSKNKQNWKKKENTSSTANDCLILKCRSQSKYQLHRRSFVEIIDAVIVDHMLLKKTPHFFYSKDVILAGWKTPFYVPLSCKISDTTDILLWVYWSRYYISLLH